jgi:hypothetical protein
MALGAKDLSSVSGSVQVVVLLAILVTICRWTVVTVQLAAAPADGKAKEHKQ